MSDKNNNDDMSVETVIARQIVAEIMTFGVTQKQLIKIIELLALELESRDMMLNLCKILRDDTCSNTASMPNMSDIRETQTKSKLII